MEWNVLPQRCPVTSTNRNTLKYDNRGLGLIQSGHRTGLAARLRRCFMLFTLVTLGITARAQPIHLDVLYTYPPDAEEGGAGFTGTLVQGADGNFYGTSTDGVAGVTNVTDQGMGCVFRVSTNGTFTRLAIFVGAFWDGSNTNGSSPLGGVIPGLDGNFYGTTDSGGESGAGTIFRITTNGVLTRIASFGDTNGWGPLAGLTLGLDGNFYGTTAAGGSNEYGTVFKVTTDGTLTPLVFFNGTNGAALFAGLTLGPDGNFYGHDH